MKVLYKGVGKDFEVIDIDNTLEVLQDKVGGYIETIPAPVKGARIICNEDGKLKGLPPNIPLYDGRLKAWDMIVGDVLIVGNGTCYEFTDLTDEQIEECQRIYSNTER